MDEWDGRILSRRVSNRVAGYVGALAITRIRALGPSEPPPAESAGGGLDSSSSLVRGCAEPSGGGYRVGHSVGCRWSAITRAVFAARVTGGWKEGRKELPRPRESPADKLSHHLSSPKISLCMVFVDKWWTCEWMIMDST